MSASLSTNDIKKTAFEILKLKCNTCHIEEHQQLIFTFDNMDGYSKKINRQVFIWKRMPKGKEVKLTTEEKDDLKTWISSVSKK